MPRTNREGIKSSRVALLTYVYGPNVVHSADVTRYMRGGATAGVALGFPFRLAKVEVQAIVNSITAAGTPTIGVHTYNGTEAAGTEAVSATSATIAATGLVTASSEVEVNAGKSEFSATDTLTVKMFYDDNTVTAISISPVTITLYIEKAE